MFKKLLVPLDLTERNRRAVEVAGELASLVAGSEVTLLHVIEAIEHPDREVEDFYGMLRGRAQERLDEWQEQLVSKGVVARQHIALGRRANEILRFAVDQDVDLIVLSSHRVDPEAPGESVGTMSHRLAILAHCQVLLVR